MRVWPSAWERTTRTRQGLLLATWVAVACVLILRAVEVQVLEKGAWAREALKQHSMTRPIPAPRGRILDRNGGELAVSRWRGRVEFNPNQLDSAQVAEALETHLGMSASEARRLTRPNSTTAWRVVPGRYSRSQVAPLLGMTGVHIADEQQRLYTRPGLARGVLGVVIDDVGREGIEQSMDSVLAGTDGREVVKRDRVGKPIPGEVRTLDPPVAGRDVMLTIDQDVQAIAEEMLANAIEATGARGGDLVITDPRTGEILAMTSVFNGSAAAMTAVNTTYEPGSTIKPVTTATLLRHGLASLNDSVDAANGAWTINGRTITDVERHGWMTLRDVLMRSSNVGIAKFAQRLTRGQQYTALRDFGFGTPTGVPLPGEASGLLRRPDVWSAQSQQSLAFGYEVSVTPLQMALAFGALANGGLLMKPLLIREVRNGAGEPVRYGRPSQIRRVIPEWVTDELTPVLADAVDDGTGTRARMISFQVAGKSGTARATGAGGRYEDGAYNSSFAAYFPADDPQLLFFVKLDRPQGEYYGGATAAPLTLATLESLLSARQSPIDHMALARVRRDRFDLPPAEPLVTFAVAIERPAGAGPSVAPATASVGVGGGVDLRDPMILPELDGASVRVALRRLHKMGLRVRLEGGGAVVGTAPPGGAQVAVGDTVIVVGRDAVSDVGAPNGAGRPPWS